MSRILNVRSGRVFARRSLKLGTALGGSLVAALAFVPSAAQAQACGAGTSGTITCTPAGNPYATGIAYPGRTADTTVVLQDGVAVQTTTASTPGVIVNGTGAVTVNGGGASVSTTGAGSNGVDVASTGGPLAVNIGTVTTSGALSGGVRAEGALNRNVTVTTGNVTTTGTAGPSFPFLPSSTAVFARTGGTGAVQVTTGNLSTRGAGASGVYAQSGAGNIAVTTGSVATTGGNASAINAIADTGSIAITANGPITTSGDGSAGASASAARGSAAATVGNVTTTGFNADGVFAQSGIGGSTVNFGTITTSGGFAEGVNADSAGGAVTVRGANVAVSGTSTAAINATSTSGAVNVVTTGNVSSTGRGGLGIVAVSNTGAAEVTANNVSVVAANAADTSTTRGAILVSGTTGRVTTTGTVTSRGRAEFGGNADAISVTGTAGDASATVNTVNAGTTGTTGGRALTVTASRDASATINGAVTSSANGTSAVAVNGGRNAAVTIGSGGSVTAAGGDAIVLASAAGGTGTLTNAGTIAANANGFAVRANGGPATINNSGTMTSDILLTGGADTVNNSGNFVVGPNPDFGAGADVFNNAGTVRFAAGATAPVSATFTGLETFNNSGTIELRNGIAGDTLTLPGAYAGTGAAALGLDVNLGATSTADRLNVGGAATGTTIVALNQLNTAPGGFNPGLTLVQAGAASNAAAFDLAGGSLNQGMVRYEIVYNPTNFSFQLVGGPSDAAFNTLNYVEGARNLWLKSADVVSGQMRARRDANWAFGGGDPAGRMWTQIHGSVETREGVNGFTSFGQNRFVNTGFEQDYFGGQLGFDFTGGSGDRGGFAVGVTGGYINSSQNFAGGNDRIKYDAINGGVYAAYSTGNIFFNVLGKYDYYWADAISPAAGFRQDVSGGVYGARGEVGIRFGSDSFFVEPAASLSYVRSDFDDFDAVGTSVDFDDDDGLRGRAGARIGTQFDIGGPVVAAYVGGNYVHEFSGEDEVTLTSNGQSLTFVNDRLNDYGEALLGVTIGQSEGISGFIEGSYTRSFKDRDGLTPMEGAGGRAGLRLKF